MDEYWTFTTNHYLSEAFRLISAPETDDHNMQHEWKPNLEWFQMQSVESHQDRVDPISSGNLSCHCSSTWSSTCWFPSQLMMIWLLPLERLHTWLVDYFCNSSGPASMLTTGLLHIHWFKFLCEFYFGVSCKLYGLQQNNPSPTSCYTLLRRKLTQIPVNYRLKTYFLML